MLNQSLKNKKVLICITNIEIGGGAEKVAVTLGNEFLKRGIDTTLLTFYTIDNEHTFNGKRVSMHEATPASVLGKLPRAFIRIWKVKQVCKQEGIDIVFSFLEESNYYVLLSKILLLNRTPMIVSVRNDLRNYNWLYRLLIRFLYPWAEKVVAVTKGVQQQLREEFSLKNTTTIYNSIDMGLVKQKSSEPLPAEYSWLKERHPLCISIGRLTQQKGQWHMIRAFVKVKKQVPAASLIILGEGPYREKLQKLIRDCGLEDSVFLLGKQNNVYHFLAQADVFVFSSIWEGMPNTLLEALSVGLPIVAADCGGGPREILTGKVDSDNDLYPVRGPFGILSNPLEGEEIWSPVIRFTLTKNEIHLAEEIIYILRRLTKVLPLEERLCRAESSVSDYSLEKNTNKWQILFED